MKGIETAFFGGLWREVELLTSKSGKPWARLMIAVDTGEEDADGHAKSQWIKVAVFGETAEKLAGAAKGTRLYVEGSLKLEEWQDKDGFDKHGLSVAAWKCEMVGVSAIGRNKPKREPDHSAPVTASYRAGPAEPRKRSSAGRFDFDRGDPLPF
jgi:single-strand DNA-binding protein